MDNGRIKYRTSPGHKYVGLQYKRRSPFNTAFIIRQPCRALKPGLSYPFLSHYTVDVQGRVGNCEFKIIQERPDPNDQILVVSA